MHDAHDRYMLHITQLFLLPAAQCVGTLVTQTARCAPECGHQLTSDHWDHSDHGDISVEPRPHPAPGKLQDQADIALLTSSIPTYKHPSTCYNCCNGEGVCGHQTPDSPDAPGSTPGPVLPPASLPPGRGPRLTRKH